MFSYGELTCLYFRKVKLPALYSEQVFGLGI